MARASSQKLKILYVMDFLLRNSDEAHPVTMSDIIGHLNSQGIPAERKSIYGDIEALQLYGLDIIQVEQGRFHGYYVGNRDFQTAELKLLVDSVQSSKFITHKKTSTLIQKIEKLASVHEAQLLNRQVFVLNRVKTMNESIYYNVDRVYSGISQNRKIRFHYFEYNTHKERVFRKNGAFYEVSPYAMCWDDENYYMVAFDSEMGIIKHYRVDKMADIDVTDDQRDGLEAYQALDMAVYARKVFGMFSGNETTVQMRFENHLVGAVLDRLGRDVAIVDDGPDHFIVRADVVVSPQFFAWVFGFGHAATILGPDHVIHQMENQLHEVVRNYSTLD